MPLLRKASDGAASASKPRSPTKASEAAAGGRSGNQRKTPVPPAPHQATSGAGASAPGADDYAVPAREVVRPTAQLALTAAELEEDIGRSLTAGNPAAPANIVRYSFRERGYRAEPIIDQQLQHFALGGCLLHRQSDEAVRDRQRRDSATLLAQSRRVTAQSRRATQQQAQAESSSLHAEPSSGLLLGAVARASAIGDDDAAAARLRNQFNFVDRAAQTGHFAPRERGSMTEPPPTASASGSCSRWEIFQAYVQDQDRQLQTEELARQKAQVARRGGGQQQQQAAATTGALALAVGGEEGGRGTSDSLAPLSAQAVRLMERMVNQNLHSEMVMDFKYWDDPADAVRQEEGTLLPLWSFASPAARRRAVTALCWSPRYPDLFAVGYGSYDFLHPTSGLVACYSLKNPSHPEYSFATSAGVLCLDFHPDHPNLLAVGCYDGRLCIFDVRAAEGGQPLYESTVRSGKHSDPVWQVCWQRTDSHELQLCSISTDGRVSLWSVSKNELSCQDLLQLCSLKAREDLLQAQPEQVQQHPSSGTAGNAATGIAGGCCFDFNREQDYLFIVGSEDGSLYKCSTAYASEYLQAYRPGHRLPVYAVRWNSLHSRTFLSAGADWKVKLWDSLLPKPVLSFDLGAPVGDVAWAPFSSTVFAAVTDGGRAHVFDLAQNRGAAVCVQRVASKARCTKLAFNTRHPVLLVGDEQGGVTCLKLSPNLRRSFNQSAADLGNSQLTRTESQRSAVVAAEAGRLEAVLELAGKCNQAMQAEDWELM